MEQKLFTPRPKSKGEREERSEVLESPSRTHLLQQPKELLVGLTITYPAPWSLTLKRNICIGEGKIKSKCRLFLYWPLHYSRHYTREMTLRQECCPQLLTWRAKEGTEEQRHCLCRRLHGTLLLESEADPQKWNRGSDICPFKKHEFHLYNSGELGVIRVSAPHLGASSENKYVFIQGHSL